MWKDEHPTIIQFLKNTSTVFRISGSEIMIHCPYCNDALRKDAHRHGHLYISTQNPVFHCFRCESSGSLGNLLQDLGFDDQDIIKSLLSKIRFNISKSDNIFKIVKSNNINFYTKNLNYRNGNQQDFEVFQNYVYGRICKNVDYSYFRLTPEKINNKLCVSIYNYYNNFVTARIIFPTNNYRYIKNKNSQELYFFQEFDFDKYKNIVLAEGPFDIISLYQFGLFPKNKTFYLSILGKNYVKICEWLISNHLLFGEYNLNLIFDNDNKFINNTVKISNFVKNRLNPNIKINGYRPIYTNDVGDLPLIREI